MPVVLFTAVHLVPSCGFHRPYLRAFRELGWQVHAACGGSRGTFRKLTRASSCPLRKKCPPPAIFRPRHSCGS